jgi:diketogulonate reductase-like aldo/keto reductase
MDEIPAIKLNNGISMPSFGFGTWRLQEGEEAQKAVTEALKLGYRLIDTAALYANERSVGEAIKSSGLPRKDIFVTTKLPGSTPGYEETFDEFETSLHELGTDYIDLYLIHSPRVGDRQKVWKALEEIQESGKARAVGVSNYSVRHLEELKSYSDFMPVVNQIEFHPFIYKNMAPILEFCKEHNIVVEAYSPLARGKFDTVTAVAAIAHRHSKTGAQILLRWALQHGTAPIPKSASPARMKENLNIFDFELSAEEMETLNNLSNGDFIVGDPADMD